MAAGLHLLLRLPPGTDEDAVVANLAARRIRVNGLNTYRLAARDEPALVLGYGRLTRPAIPATVATLAQALLPSPPAPVATATSPRPSAA